MVLICSGLGWPVIDHLINVAKGKKPHHREINEIEERKRYTFLINY